MMADNVVALCPKEQVHQSAEPIATIYRNLGTASAEQVVTRALGEVALTMAGLADKLRVRDLNDLARQARKLQGLADNLGMVSLSRVAADLRTCLDQGDSTAFSAVWARLIRIAEGSLVSDPDLLGSSFN